MPESKAQAPVTPLKQPMDKLLFALTWMLLGVGVVAVLDASYAPAIEYRHGDALYYLKRQVVWALFSVAALWGTFRVPYWRWRKYAVAGAAIAVVMLVATLVPHLGVRVMGARRWLGHGNFRVQPSEFAKLALVLYLARVASVGAKTMRNFSMGVLPPLLVIAVMSVLIAVEPDTGTAIVLGGTGLIVLFLSGARPKHIVSALAGAASIVFLHALSKPYQLHRLTSFLDPRANRLGDGYQVWHGLIALGSGGLAGLGLGEGREKLYIPMARSDFIFPVIAEEWGLIGTVTLVIIFLLVAARGFSISHQTKDPFGALLAAGATTLISLQAVVNIAVATSSIPDTGVPLPFISEGGSSLLVMMACIGLLLNISCYPHGPHKPETRDKWKRETNEDEFNRRWDRPYVQNTEYRARPAATQIKRSDRSRRRGSRLFRG